MNGLCRPLLAIPLFLMAAEGSLSQEPINPSTVVLLSPNYSDPASQIFIETFTEELEKADILVKAFPANMIVGEYRDIPTNLRTSDFSLAYLPAEAVISSDNADEFVFSELTQQPGFIENLSQNFAVQDSVVGDLIATELADVGLELISFWSRPAETLLAKVDISSVDDLAGMKVAQGSGATAEVLQIFGAQPTTIAAGDIFEALEKGQADAWAFTSSDDLNQLGMFKTSGAATLVDNISHEQGYLVASHDWWVGLSQNSRNSISDAAEKANEASRQSLLQVEAGMEAYTKELGIKYVSIGNSGWEEVRQVSEKNWLSDGDFESRNASLETLRAVLEETRVNRDRNGGFQRRGDIESTVLFATNRNDEKAPTIEDRFGILKTSDNRLNCGAVTYQPSQARKFGKPYSGRLSLQQNKIWSGPSDCADFWRETIITGQKPTVYFHGYDNTFDDAVRRGIGIKSDFGIDGPLFVWSWPSEGTRGGYVFDLNSVTYSEQYVEQFVESLKQADLLNELTVIAHSMGSRMAAYLLKTIRAENGKIQNLILVAPDFPPSLFEQVLQQNQSALLLRTIYSNQYDRALLLSEQINRETPIGRGGRYLRVVDDIETVDVSGVAHGGWSNHSHGFEVQEVVEDIVVLIAERKAAALRGLEEASANGKAYWLIAD